MIIQARTVWQLDAWPRARRVLAYVVASQISFSFATQVEYLALEAKTPSSRTDMHVDSFVTTRRVMIGGLRPQ